MEMALLSAFQNLLCIDLLTLCILISNVPVSPASLGVSRSLRHLVQCLKYSGCPGALLKEETARGWWWEIGDTPQGKRRSWYLSTWNPQICSILSLLSPDSAFHEGAVGPVCKVKPTGLQGHFMHLEKSGISQLGVWPAHHLGVLS